MPWKHNRSKPVIGLAGGIGSGKSLIARQFASQGCVVIDSDADAHAVLQSPAVRAALREWMGDSVFLPDGSVNRKAVGSRVFSDAEAISRLNGLIHPRVGAMREAAMPVLLRDGAFKAIVWDMPLLFEVGLAEECDAVVFVDCPRENRLARVASTRGWVAEELDKREKLQILLDKKAELADYCISNDSDEASSLGQVQQVLSQILARGD